MIKKIIKVISLAIIILNFGCNTASSRIEIDEYFRYNFDLAIENRSSAPSFVLIEVADDNTNEKWEVCTEAGTLVYAMGYENKENLKNGSLPSRESHLFAKKNKDNVFHFSDSRALELLKRPYSQKVLNELELELNKYRLEDILPSLAKKSQVDITKLYRSKDQYALAHLLIKRGLACGRGSYQGRLFLGNIYMPGNRKNKNHNKSAVGNSPADTGSSPKPEPL